MQYYLPICNRGSPREQNISKFVLLFLAALVRTPFPYLGNGWTGCAEILFVIKELLAWRFKKVHGGVCTCACAHTFSTYRERLDGSPWNLVCGYRGHKLRVLHRTADCKSTRVTVYTFKHIVHHRKGILLVVRNGKNINFFYFSLSNFDLLPYYILMYFFVLKSSVYWKTKLLDVKLFFVSYPEARNNQYVLYKFLIFST